MDNATKTKTSGIYELDADVLNPKADHRKNGARNPLSAPIIPKGTRIYLEISPAEHSMRFCHAHDSLRRYANEELFATLLLHLRAVTPNALSVFEAHARGALGSYTAGIGISVIQKLIDAGNVTLDDVRGALKEQGEEEV